MPTRLSSNEESVLYAVYEATKQAKKECLNPQEIGHFLLPEARVGQDELWGAVVEICDPLVSLGHLECCEPGVQIGAHRGYKLTKKGKAEAEKLQPGKVDKGL